MQQSARTWIVGTICLTLAAWVLVVVLRWFGPAPQSIIESPAPATEPAVIDARAIGLLNMTEPQQSIVAARIDASMRGVVPLPQELARAVTQRLEVLRKGDWDSFTQYVHSASIFGPKADLSLRDRAAWDRDMMYWSSAMLYPDRTQAFVVSRGEVVVWSRTSGSIATRDDNGLYSSLSKTTAPEIVVSVEVPALVLDTIPMDKHVQAALVMDFAFVKGRWVPLRTGVWFPPNYPNPGIPPWL
ncbi:MAG: hypothetical protein ACK5ZG_12030 [Phycisphaerae bacterium]|jgi:hypothetical protein